MQRFILLTSGASPKSTGLAPAACVKSRGDCGPNPAPMVAAARDAFCAAMTSSLTGFWLVSARTAVATDTVMRAACSSGKNLTWVTDGFLRDRDFKVYEAALSGKQ